MSARALRWMVTGWLFEAWDWLGDVALEVAGAVLGLWPSADFGGHFPMGLQGTVMLITPELAREWIAAGSLLGPPNWRRAKQIAREWEAHEWRPGVADPILRTDTGLLVGRGTRVAAVKISGMAIRFLVIVVPEAVARRMLEELDWPDGG